MRYLFILSLFISLSSAAQWKSYKLNPKGDTLNRVDMNGRKQGPWVIQVPELRGERGYDEEGVFVNDLKEGIWRKYSPEGDLIAMENYRFGYRHGKNAYFNNQGELIREEMWRAIDPKSPYDTINVYDVNDPNRVVRTEVVKVEPNSYKHGVWKYYDPRYGTLEKSEEYVMDKIKEKPKPVSDDDLAPIDVASGGSDSATVKKTEPKAKVKPKEVVEFEKKNAGKKSIKVRTGATGG